MSDGRVYRGVVLESNATTGKVVVSIPAIAGSNRFTVSTVGRAPIRGRWKVPPVNSVVLLTAEDQDLTTLFLIPTYTHDKEVVADDAFVDVQGPVVVLGVNKQGSTIAKGTAVYATADGGQLGIQVASANNAAKMPAIGITTEEIASNKTGKVAVSGLVTGINTSGLSAGVKTFVGNNGALTINASGLGTTQVIGRTVKVGATDGSFLVSVYLPSETGTGGSAAYTGTFTGDIYATGGVLGGTSEGWLIQADRIESFGSGDKIILDGRDGEIYIGTFGNGTYNGASTPFYVNKSGQFSLGNRLTFDGSTLNVNGTITAAAGSIAGWTINPNTLTSGSSTNTVTLSSDGSYALWAGSANAATAPLRIQYDGSFAATNASVSGNISATAGSIGGWVIQGTRIESVGGMDKIVLDGDTTGTGSDAKIYVGNENWGNSNNGFYVDDRGRFGLGANLTWDPDALPTSGSGTGVMVLNGQIDAQTATFAGWSLRKGRLFAGTAGDYVEINAETALDTDSTRREYATWAGHPNPLLAPFAVRRDGYITRASTGGLNLLETTEVYGRLRVRSSTNGSMGLGVGVNPSESENGLWINNSNYWYDDGRFRTGSSLSYVSWNGATLEVTGRIIATSGSFTGAIIADSGSIGGATGWQIGAGSLTSSSVGLIPGSFPFYAGSNAASAAPFRVTNTGVLTAASADITGTINATNGSFTGGTIGGFFITGSSLSAGTGASTVGMVPGSWPFFSGGSAPAVARFRVDNAGNLFATNVSISGNITATGGNIGGWTPGSGSLTNGSSGMNPGTWPIFCGASNPSNPATARFRVNDQGQMWATDANIAGTVTATSGSIGGWTISASAITTGGISYPGLVSGTTIVAGGNSPIRFQAGSGGVFRVDENGAVYSSSFNLMRGSSTVANLGSVGEFTDILLDTGEVSIYGYSGGGFVTYDTISLNLPSSGGALPGGLFWSPRLEGSFYYPTVQLRGPYYSTTSEALRPRVQMEAKSGTGNGNKTALGLIAANVYVSGSALFLKGGGDVTTSATSGRLVLGSTSGGNMGIDENEIQARTGNSASSLFINANGGLVRISSGELEVDGGAGIVRFTGGLRNVDDSFSVGTAGNMTCQTITSTPPNASGLADAVWSTTSGAAVLRRGSVSSRRFKHDITPLSNADLDPTKLLNIPVVQFKYNNDYLSEDDYLSNKDIPGLIAEDVFDHYPIAARVSDDGVVENWSERVIIPPMLKLIQDLHARVEALEAAV